MCRPASRGSFSLLTFGCVGLPSFWLQPLLFVGLAATPSVVFVSAKRQSSSDPRPKLSPEPAPRRPPLPATWPVPALWPGTAFASSIEPRQGPAAALAPWLARWLRPRAQRPWPDPRIAAPMFAPVKCHHWNCRHFHQPSNPKLRPLRRRHFDSFCWTSPRRIAETVCHLHRP